MPSCDRVKWNKSQLILRATEHAETVKFVYTFRHAILLSPG